MSIILIGTPMGLMYCFEVAFFFALTLSMGILGTITQAANQVALQYLCLFMSVVFSIAQAITVRMGHLLGAKEIEEAKKASHIGVGIVVIFMGFIGILYWFFPNLLISPDFNVHQATNVEIVKEIQSLLAVCALFQIFEGARIALFGSLRALKDTRFTLRVSIISFWFIALPLGFLLAIYFNMGGTGFWWSMAFGALCNLLLLHKRFILKIRREAPVTRQ